MGFIEMVGIVVEWVVEFFVVGVSVIWFVVDFGVVVGVELVGVFYVGLLGVCVVCFVWLEELVCLLGLFFY